MIPSLGVRWTIGDVSEAGYEALVQSIAGARALFGDSASYAVVVNTVSLDVARERLRDAGAGVELIAASAAMIPDSLRPYIDKGMAEGVAWKFAPPRLFRDRLELALDNDCILWELPRGIRDWLDAKDGFVIAADVRACFGQFAPLLTDEPRNTGIRGFPPAFNLAASTVRLLDEFPAVLRSELDEQGLQVAVMERSGENRLVSVDEVSICSPFWPHRQHLGSCGAHFVGLNAHELPWKYYGTPAVECVRDHWARLRSSVRQRVQGAAASGGPRNDTRTN